MNICDCVAIVTGGSSGLGASTAAMLVKHGGQVAIIDVNDDKGEAYADTIGATLYKADVSNEAEVDAALEEIGATQGAARILVCCAAVAPAIPTLGSEGTHAMDAFRRTIEVNLVGAYLILSRFASRMHSLPPFGEERGVAIVTSSIAAFDGQARFAAYSASKAGLAGLILPTALDLDDLRIRVMGIAPGLFQTPLLNDIPGADRNSLFTQVPHPARAGAPDEFAQLVRAIIENPMLNGSVIRIDGGLRLAPA